MQREQDAFRVNWPGAYAAIPKDIFYRDNVYQRELNRIFGGPEWHPVAHRGEVPERGDFKSDRIGGGAASSLFTAMTAKFVFSSIPAHTAAPSW